LHGILFFVILFTKYIILGGVCPKNSMADSLAQVLIKESENEKKVTDMIDQDKLKTMTQLALYEKKKGKKDFITYSYDRGDYIRFQGLKTAVFVTLAVIAVIGIILVWNLNTLIQNFDVLDYGRLFAIAGGSFALILFLYMYLSYRQCREEYNHMVPRIRRYQRGIKKLKKHYMIEDKQQRDFEKGEWRNGQ